MKSIYLRISELTPTYVDVFLMGVVSPKRWVRIRYNTKLAIKKWTKQFMGMHYFGPHFIKRKFTFFYLKIYLLLNCLFRPRRVWTVRISFVLLWIPFSDFNSKKRIFWKNKISKLLFSIIRRFNKNGLIKNESKNHHRTKVKWTNRLTVKKC